MKLICHFDLLKCGKKVAVYDAELANKRGADLTPLYNQTNSAISYVVVKKLAHIPKGYDIANVEIRLLSNRRILKKKARRRHGRISGRGGRNMLVWRDQTFCKPEHSTKPECAEYFRRFDALKYSDYCPRYWREPPIAWALEPMCEPKTRNDKTATNADKTQP